MPGARTGIQELNVAILIQPELQSLRHIVHLGTDDGVGQLNLVLKLLINVHERATLRETLGYIVVLAAYL